MKGSRVLIWLLLLATVLVDCVALCMFGTGRLPQMEWPHPVLSVLFALPFSQVGLAAIWVGLGVPSAPWRLTGGFLVVVCWSIALAATLGNDVPAGYTSTHWTALLLGQTLAILIPLSIARPSGVRLAGTPATDPRRGSAAERTPWQFSLGYLLAWITAVAIVLGMVQYTIRYELLPRAPIAWVEIGILSVSHGGIALSLLWIMLGTVRPTLQIAMPCSLTLLFVGGSFWLACDSGFRSALGMLFFGDALLLVGSLWVLRVAGYRVRVKGGRMKDEG